MPYEIRRHYLKRDDTVLIKTVDTEEEAQAHCNDPQTSSSTCTDPAMLEHADKHGPWFDGYYRTEGF